MTCKSKGQESNLVFRWSHDFQCRDMIYLVIAGFGEGPEVWVIVLQLGEGQLLLFVEADGQWRDGTCGNRHLKWASLVSGAGNPSTHSKWEVNTQPQEVIQLQRGPIRPQQVFLPLDALVLPHLRVWDRAPPSQWRKFAQQFEEKGFPSKVLYCAAFIPPTPSASH